MKDVIKRKIHGYNVEEPCSDTSKIKFMSEFQKRMNEVYDEKYKEKSSEDSSGWDANGSPV